MGNLLGFAVAVVEVGCVDAHVDLLVIWGKGCFLLLEICMTLWLVLALRLCSDFGCGGFERERSLLEVECVVA